jgi:hypothetical protein
MMMMMIVVVVVVVMMMTTTEIIIVPVLVLGVRYNRDDINENLSLFLKFVVLLRYISSI